jgi:hypothetical protein
LGHPTAPPAAQPAEIDLPRSNSAPPRRHWQSQAGAGATGAVDTGLADRLEKLHAIGRAGGHYATGIRRSERWRTWRCSTSTTTETVLVPSEQTAGGCVDGSEQALLWNPPRYLPPESQTGSSRRTRRQHPVRLSRWGEVQPGPADRYSQGAVKASGSRNGGVPPVPVTMATLMLEGGADIPPASGPCSAHAPGDCPDFQIYPSRSEPSKPCITTHPDHQHPTPVSCRVLPQIPSTPDDDGPATETDRDVMTNDLPRPSTPFAAVEVLFSALDQRSIKENHLRTPDRPTPPCRAAEATQ